MNASLKWCKGPAGVIRVHPPGRGYGEDWEWACTVEREGDVAVLHGVKEFPDIKWRSPIRKALKAEGFAKVRWFRADKGWVEFNL